MCEALRMRNLLVLLAVVLAFELRDSHHRISWAAEPGTSWGIGTELNLVRRLANAHPDKDVHFLEDTVCFCSTMNRIDLPHLVWALESLVAGDVPNVIVVDEETERLAKIALDRMLSLPAVNPAKD